MTSGGNNFNDFSDNQLTKSRAAYTVKANRGAENAGVENAGVKNAGVDSRGIPTDELST